MTVLRAGSATDVGLVRANNQDESLVAHPLFAVADGMGGHAAGEVASALACQALAQAFAAGPHSADALVAATHQANRAVYERAQANPEMRGMGTTLVAVALTDAEHQTLAIAHVGDSRVYLLRRGELSQVTSDHSLVAELVAEGQIPAEEAEFHPQRHVLSRALGVYPSVDVDLTVVDPQTGDRYLLCSDGLSREVTDDQIAAVLLRLADPNEAAQELVEAAKARGGADNITVVLVDVTDDPAGGPAPAVAAPDGDIPPILPGDDPTKADDNVDATSVVPAVTARTVPGPEAASHQRIFTVRFVAFVVALFAVVAITIGGIDYYARSSYYVGLQGNQLIIYQGRPGGVLWFDPTVASRTGVTTAQIESRHLSELRSGMTESTRGAARQYVANLVAEEKAAQSPFAGLSPGGAP